MFERSLSPKNFGLALGILWGVSLLVWTLIAVQNGWGAEVLNLLSGIYIGYDISLLGALFGGIWGFADGFLGGYILIWLYNFLERR